MAGNPREHVTGKGFWDGGTGGQSSNGQSGGRPSGFPGRRIPKRVGLRTEDRKSRRVLFRSLVLLATAFMLFTAGLVNAIALAFAAQPWGFAVSFFIVMAIYASAGGILALYGWRTIKAGGLAPEKTMRVLKQDQVWLKTEARTQL